MLNNNDPQNSWFDRILRHKFLTFVIVIGMIFCVCLVTYMSPRWYHSEAGLYFRIGRENAALDATASVGQSPVLISPNSRQRELNSIVEILTSRGMAEVLVEQIGQSKILQDAKGKPVSSETQQGWFEYLNISTEISPKEKAVLHVSKQLKVTAADEANVLWVTYEARTPEFARLVVNELIGIYLEKHLEFHRTAGSHEFLAQQTELSRLRLAEKEDKLKTAKNETLLVSPDEQEQALVNQAAKLEMDLILSETEELSLSKRVSKLESLVTKIPETQIISKTSGLSNDAADKMRDQLFTLQIQEQELLARYTKDHPAVIAVRQQIAETKTILEKEDDLRTAVVEGISKVREQGDISMLELVPLFESTKRKSEALREQLAQTHEQLRILNDKELGVTRLQREVELADAEYRKYSAGLDQARLDAALEMERISNVNIIQQPTLVSKPVRPNWILNLAIGTLLAFLAAWSITGMLDSHQPARSTNVSIAAKETRASYPNVAPQSTV